MYCPKCGYKNEENAVFCIKCGARIEEKRDERKIVEKCHDKSNDFQDKGNLIEKKSLNDRLKPLIRIKEIVVAVVPIVLIIMALTGKFDNFFHEISNGAYGKADNYKVTAIDANSENDVNQEIKQENSNFDMSEYKLYEAVLMNAFDAYGTGNEYAVCDIDSDGIIELIVSHGTCDADWINDVYTLDGGEVIYIGGFNNYSALYYSDMNVTNDGQGIISVSGRQGIENIDQIKKSGNYLTVENVVYREVEDDLYYGNEMSIYLQSIDDITLLMEVFNYN